MDELKGIGDRRICAGWYVKGHCILRLTPPGPEEFRERRVGRRPSKNIHPYLLSTSDGEQRGVTITLWMLKRERAGDCLKDHRSRGRSE
jgi:hypothetical protein